MTDKLGKFWGKNDPILFTPLPIVISFRFLQALMKLISNVSIPSGKEMLSRASQLLKTNDPTVFTPSGMFISFSDLQP